MKYFRIVLLWGFVLLWMFFILGLSSHPAEISNEESSYFVEILARISSTLEDRLHIPMPDLDQIDFLVRKSAHMFNYFVLTLLLIFAFKVSFLMVDKSWLRSLTGAGVISLLFSMLDEFYQTFIPGRAGRITDVGVDLIGTLIGIGLMLFLFNDRLDTVES